MYTQPQQAIYSLKNKVTGRQYIGGTSNFQHRKVDHLYRLRNRVSWIKNLQDDFDLYEEESFEFVVLEHLNNLTKNEIEKREQVWIDCIHPEYNLSQKAGSCIRDNAETPEAKEKMRKSLTGRKQTPEHVAHRVATMIKNGKQHLKIVTPEQKKHLSEINMGDKNPNWGLHRSEETKRIVSEKNGKDYVGAVDPNGKIYAPIHGMNRFCIENRLCTTSMVELMKGKIKQHKGWTRFENGGSAEAEI